MSALTAFEVGLFGWMALMFFVFFPAQHLHPESPVYWFLMQIGVIARFVTTLPASAWLIRADTKEPMSLGPPSCAPHRARPGTRDAGEQCHLADRSGPHRRHGAIQWPKQGFGVGLPLTLDAIRGGVSA